MKTIKKLYKLCTLTYIPVGDGYIFTHNRDERMDRPTGQEFQKKVLQDQTIYYPEDLEAHGTWIAFSDKNTSACLLNGGNIPHLRLPNYRKSRGLVVLESFEFDSMPRFVKQYDFRGIEPFTLLVKNKKGLFKVVHNENETFLEEKDPAKPGIWSSTTLYTDEVRAQRQDWFKDWLRLNAIPNPGSIKKFHTTAGTGDIENDLMMSRWGLLKTLSITQIISGAHKAELHYEDFIQDSFDIISVAY